MATTYSIEQLLVKEAGRIGPEIYRRTVDTSAWLKLTKQEQFPEEMGDVISSVTFERFYPSSSIAASTANGYTAGDITGDAGYGWRNLGSNPIDQTYTGFNMAWVTPDTIATIIGLVTPVLVWVIPNKKVV